MKFYLGAHMPHWLSLVDVPLFVSYTRLCGRKRLPRARASWALDSGGFTELSKHGRWKVPPERYAADVRRYAAEIGQLDWAAPQDWMCEPQIRAMTGRSVEYHHGATIASVAELRDLVGGAAHVIPVLQGWALRDYLNHVDMYARNGIDLSREPVVGVGSVCRRQGSFDGARIVREIARLGVRVHAFGFKITGLMRTAACIASADSMAWSYAARRSAPMSGHRHKSCANCLEYALRWRGSVLRRVGAQGDLLDGWMASA